VTKVRLRNLCQSLADRRDAEDTFLKQGRARKSWPIIGGQERQERHVFWSKARLGWKSLPIIGGQERHERHVFWSKARLGWEILANHWRTGETRETRFLEQGPARLGNPCQSLADRRDGRDTFWSKARLGWEIFANHWQTGETDF
jgi:hypothetical protein